MCTVRTFVYEGVPVAVYQVHRFMGFPGRPFVVQVADMYILDGGKNVCGRAKRYATAEKGVRDAVFFVSVLLQRRRALREAWLP